jgi:hypothetical protein
LAAGGVVALCVCDPLPAIAGEGFAISGIGGGLHSFYSYQGVIYAPLGTLSESGPLVRGWAKSFSFTYETELPTDPEASIDALGYGVEGEVGWQLAGEFGRIAAFAGAAWRDHELDPPDPGSDLEDARIALALTVDGEWKADETWGVMANAHYLTGFDQYCGLM